MGTIIKIESKNRGVYSIFEVNEPVDLAEDICNKVLKTFTVADSRDLPLMVLTLQTTLSYVKEYNRKDIPAELVYVV